jgi:EAL domain-containing protein (putative c-di-GMP-specific phosphodiesterase class I)/CheY-like chemotaxis protein
LSRIRVLIADDEPVLREALSDLISDDASMELVAAAQDADQAIGLAREHRPDVAVLDVKMPRGGGPRAAREIRAASPLTRMVALSAYGDRVAVVEMLRAGAVGYLLKGASADEILQAIRGAVEGHAPVGAEVAGQLIAELSTQLQREERVAEETRAQIRRIKLAMEGEGLTMVFQPIFDLRQGSIVGLEALSRFTNDPSRPPNSWFAEAQTVGLGLELELAAVEAALSRLLDLPSDAFLSINLSPEVAAGPEFVRTVAGAPGERLVIEVTEHAPIANYQALIQALDNLRSRGLRLAIDDAGAGYASLNHILQLSPEFIKMDMALTHGIDTDPKRRALAHALIAFASEIGAVIVAEGIETQEELDTLRVLGVAYGQGFYLARPGPLSVPEPAERQPL